ncbi:hypothetical protein NL533_32945, partial [Klebsiella pneumoniae]|nr:hypothetical protein [Klebsiella pneumoniae]
MLKQPSRSILPPLIALQIFQIDVPKPSKCMMKVQLIRLHPIQHLREQYLKVCIFEGFETVSRSHT